ARVAISCPASALLVAIIVILSVQQSNLASRTRRGKLPQASRCGLEHRREPAETALFRGRSGPYARPRLPRTKQHALRRPEIAVALDHRAHARNELRI